MRNRIKYFILGAVLGISGVAVAQCGPTGITPTPQAVGLCEGTQDTVFFAPIGTCNGGTWQYQVELGASVVQAWGNTAYFAVPPVSGTYTVRVRCSACPTVTDSDTFLIEVINLPVISGDTLACYGTGTTLTATGGGSGPTTWWNAPSGGTQVSSTNVLNTGNLTSSTTYYAQATGTVSSGAQGSILITECGLAGFQPGADNDYIEITNLYTTPVNTTGWKVVVSNSYSAVNTYNTTIWNLPASFAPCSMLSKTDISGSQNYWGSNIFWNPNNSGWAMILDNNWQVVDFVAWGWNATQLAGFSPVISGNPITLGTQWSGNGCPSACGSTTSPVSISRVGVNDNNVAGDFVCQPTSLNAVNPSLNCGWVAINMACPVAVNVIVDQPPTASNPAALNVQCIADVPVPNVNVVTDEADDFSTPVVTYIGETTSGTTCPEVLTRTYRVTDSCSNYIDVTQTITINDNTPPVIDPPPADLTVACIADVPAMVGLNWTDNCTGSGVVAGTEVTSGTSCPITITRTWSVSDNCGNTSTRTQVITVDDNVPPVIDPAPANVTVSCYVDVPPMVDLAWTDNCTGSGIVQGVEVTDGNSCPETLTRTWTVTDDCGNVSTRTQVVVIHDLVAPDMSPAPTNVTVQCYADIPPVVALNWTDNCDGAGSVQGVEVSNGQTCPETFTRTWSYTDGCGNTVTRTQVVIVNDITPPTSNSLPTEQVIVLPPPDINLINASDNCSTPVVSFVNDVSDNGFCPETVTRTYRILDDCGNETLVLQEFIVGDPFPNVSFTANPTTMTNLMDGIVEFFNHSTGAVAFEWDFDDGFYSTDVDPIHEFAHDETAGYVVQLVGFSEFGCTDTFQIVITVREELLYYIPNSFTPDDDKYNQIFLPIFTSGFDPTDFHLAIYNRWGEIVFESYDHHTGWDGTYNGEEVQQGTYTWKIDFGDEYTDERIILSGHVTLIR